MEPLLVPLLLLQRRSIETDLESMECQRDRRTDSLLATDALINILPSSFFFLFPEREQLAASDLSEKRKREREGYEYDL